MSPNACRLGSAASRKPGEKTAAKPSATGARPRAPRGPPAITAPAGAATGPPATYWLVARVWCRCGVELKRRPPYPPQGNRAVTGRPQWKSRYARRRPPLRARRRRRERRARRHHEARAPRGRTRSPAKRAAALDFDKLDRDTGTPRHCRGRGALAGGVERPGLQPAGVGAGRRRRVAGCGFSSTPTGSTTMMEAPGTGCRQLRERLYLADPADELQLFSSAVSIWEMRLKFHARHRDGARKSRFDPKDVLAALEGLSVPVLAMTPAHAAQPLETPLPLPRPVRRTAARPGAGGRPQTADPRPPPHRPSARGLAGCGGITKRRPLT